MTKRLAIVFDFDDTLAHDSTSSFLEHMGIDVPLFWERSNQLIAKGWDPIPAYLHLMIDVSRHGETKKRITKEHLQNWGTKIKCRDGLSQFFNRVKKSVKSHDKNAHIEFFIISSGIGEIIRNFKYRKQFKDIWASDFAYNKTGEIAGVKNVVSFTDKTRFLFQIQKGIFGSKAMKNPFEVNKKIDDRDIYIPFDRMIFVGDGFTDVPCFSLVQKLKGVPIGVYDREAKKRWGRAWGLLTQQRVSQLVAADFKKGSGLDDAIELALQNILRTPEFS